jgi:hypothetical protein
VLSLALAGGVAALMESLDTSVRGRQDLTDIFAVAPLAIIPRISTDIDSRTDKRRWRFAAGTAAVVGITTVLAVHFLFRPLDVLWFIAMRRMGL